MKKFRNIIWPLLLLLAVCGLSGCGDNASQETREAGKKAAETLEKAGSSTGRLVLDAKLAISLEGADLPAELAEEIQEPVISRTLTLDTKEDYASGRSVLEGKALFSDVLGEQSVSVSFAGEGERLFLLQEDLWGSRRMASGKTFSGFFRDLLARIGEGGLSAAFAGEQTVLEGTDCCVIEASLSSKEEPELFRELFAVSGETEIVLPVKVYLRAKDMEPLFAEIDCQSCAGALEKAAFADSWVTPENFNLKACTLTFKWESFGEAGGLSLPEGTAEASEDLAIPDSLLPALLYAGSDKLEVKLTENIDMLLSIFTEYFPEESGITPEETGSFAVLPEDEAGTKSDGLSGDETEEDPFASVPSWALDSTVSLPDIAPGDDVEDIQGMEEEAWIDQEDSSVREVAIAETNVGSVKIGLVDGQTLLGFEGNYAAVKARGGDGYELMVEYSLAQGVSAAEAAADATGSEGFSADLGYQNVTIGPARTIDVNGLTYGWSSSSYVLDAGDGSLENILDISAWLPRGNGLLRVHITVTCDSLNTAQILNPTYILVDHLCNIYF